MGTSPEELLLEELASPQKAVRVSAIARAARMSADSRVVHALQELCKDGDLEIAMFARMTLARLEPAAGIPVAAAAEALTSERLARPKKADVPAILQKFRENPEAIASDLRPAMAKFLASHGSQQDVEPVLRWLGESPDDQAIPFVEALEAISPQHLLPVLPRFLASKVPSVRGRAVAVLNRLDPQEALGHLSELLASENREEQLNGLRVAFQFPFTGVAAPVLTMLAETTDQEIFQASAIFLLSNPDLEVAYRLLEMTEVLSEPRAGLVAKVLAQVLPMLVSIGMLDAASASPEGLARRHTQDRLQKFLADLEVQISLGNPDKLKAIEAWLAKNLTNPETARFVEKLATSPATEEMYRRLMEISSGSAEAPAKTSIGTQAQDIRQGSPEEKIAFLKKLSGTIPPDLATWIKQEADRGPDQVRAAALRAMRLLPLSTEDLQIAVNNLFQPALVASQAMALLEKFDPGRLQQYLLRLLKSSDSQISSRAVSLSLKLHEDEAIRALTDMLASEKAAVRAQAVNGLMVCPFPKVSPTVFAALKKESNPDIARGLLSVVLNNPSPQMLEELDGLPPSQNPAVAVVIAQFRSMLFKLLLSLGMINEGEQAGTPAAAPVPAPAPPKPYSVAGVTSAIRQREIAERRAARDEQAAGHGLLPRDFPLGMAAGVVLLIGGLIGLALLSRPAARDDIPQAGNLQEGARQTSTTLKMYVMCRLSGKVTAVESPGVIRFMIGERCFRLKFRTKPPVILGHEEAEVDIVPYMKLKNGDIVAECYSFKAR